MISRGQPLRTDDRIRIHPNGSLEISNVQSSDAANYTCRASNVYGADEITISLVVQGELHKISSYIFLIFSAGRARMNIFSTSHPLM
jgi:hypothetical protein